jgi:hypothetical protein
MSFFKVIKRLFATLFSAVNRIVRTGTLGGPLA